jgi:hypothetical protein
MAARDKKKMLRVSAGIFAAGLATFGVLAPASAQGIFERIFGGLRHAVEAPAQLPASISGFAPFASPSENVAPRGESGPASAYCVRTCDGHFFPVRAHAGASAADACRAFCPASQTKLYSGGGIERAVAADGSRYGDLDTAFVYRKKLVDGCTCNGSSPFGVARVDVNSDPTLRPGDIVATKSGMAAFAGMKNKVADFTPVPKGARDKVSDLKIMPPNPGAPNVAPVTLGGHRRGDDNRSAQR